MFYRINNLAVLMRVTGELVTQPGNHKEFGCIAAQNLPAARNGPRGADTGSAQPLNGGTDIEQNVEYERSDEYHSLITIADGRLAQAKAA